ncbi:hypothetical protein [Actinophytocola sp.]|uniref:hypothetical protein n=1 Tax=Actinophytocola sp. TaxID=1872138 RepID=UPI002ED84496
MTFRTIALAVALALLPGHLAAAAEPELTLAFTDRAGAPAARAEATLINLDTGDHLSTDSAGGTATIPATPGRYILYSIVYTGRSEASLLLWPRLEVSGPATLALDARLARPVEVRVPHRSARVAAAVIISNIDYTIDGEARGAIASVSTAEAPRVSSAQLGSAEPVAGVHSRIKVNLAEPDAAGDFRASPYHYTLQWAQEGRMWTGLREEVRAADLDTVRADYATLDGKFDAYTGAFDVGGGVDRSIGVPITLPHKRTEFFTKGVAWNARVCFAPDLTAGQSCLSGKPASRWNYGPYLPAARFIERLDNRIRIIAGLADQSGHLGLDEGDIVDGRFTLYRDGVKVGETSLDQPGFDDLPAEPARYRMEFDGSMATLLPGSFHAAWTFESGYAPIGEGMLPTLNVRFTPKLDNENHAVAGRPLTLPIEVAGGDARAVTVDLSFDAGKTWRPATVRPARAGWTTTVTPPADAADISLRAHASDADGNAVEQVMTRAIPLRPAGG